MENKKEGEQLIFEMSAGENGFKFTSSIEAALIATEAEINGLKDTIKSVERIRPDCDKLDYALAASSGALCGIIDIFLVGKPGESPAGNITDKWFENRTKDFAKLCGWTGQGNASSAIKFLEGKFKIPYDQRGAGDAGSIIFGLTPSNHHFKSLAHNPTLVGLFFSILDQFRNESHFISNGEQISLQSADGKFELHGRNISGKYFCGFINWFGHLISDISGSSGSKGRGMGIPSPFWAWSNSIISIKSELNIPISDFDKTVNELALSIYKEGYDIRFQTAQVIPVLVNEVIVRFIYSLRRLMNYLKTTVSEHQSASAMWKSCEPFSNPTVKRMLTVAHGTFCMMDMGDATIRAYISGGCSFNINEFFLRLNIIGLGRFTISLYGEANRAFVIKKAVVKAIYSNRELKIVENYLNGLKLLANIYDDDNLLNFIDDFIYSDMYIQAFKKSSQLAELRSVDETNILRTKFDIDSYFKGSNQ